MNSEIKPYQVVLASKSPRRKYLLEQAGVEFVVIPSQIDEKSITFTQPERYVKTCAEKKAKNVAVNYPQNWIIGADTIVLIDGSILGKPKTIEEARTMLQRLSGRIHEVLTGYCITCESKKISHTNVIKTQVLFKELTENEIEWYIKTREPFDKAGAYAIQGIGTFLVRRINGSYTNVVGLPVCEVIEFLIETGVDCIRREDGITI